MSIAIENNIQEQKDQIVYIPIDDIHEDDEFNCRGKRISTIDVHDLIENIRKTGLDYPLLIRQYSEERMKATGFRWGLVAGYRRYRALQKLGWKEAPCIIKTEEDGSPLSDTSARLKNFQENVIRENLNIVQEARTIEKLRVAGLTYAEIAEDVHKSSGWVQVRLSVLKFPEAIQEEIGKGVLNQTQIKALATLPREKQVEEFKRLKTRKERGEKNVTVKRPISQLSKRARNGSEIKKLKDHIYSVLGASFTTRVLAWATGDVPSLEIFQEIKEQAEELGKFYRMPEEEL